MEIWRNIKGLEGKYQISSEGRVRSLDRIVEYFSSKKNDIVYQHTKGRILKTARGKDGYLQTSLGKGIKNQKIHRLVGEAFIPNPDNMPEIDHINGDNTDNRVENLRWTDRKGNMNNPITKKRLSDVKEKKTVLQLDMDGNVIAEFPSLHEMQRQLGYSRWAVLEVIRGNLKTYKGYKWEFKPL
jgi:hypothetical protein